MLLAHGLNSIAASTVSPKKDGKHGKDDKDDKDDKGEKTKATETEEQGLEGLLVVVVGLAYLVLWVLTVRKAIGERTTSATYNTDIWLAYFFPINYLVLRFFGAVGAQAA